MNMNLVKEVTNEEILKWTQKDLNAYIKAQTKGMSVRNKMKFANALIKRIKEAKKQKQ